MKVTVIYQYYQSDNAPGHSLIYDWTQHLAAKGHDVTVIAGETGYMQSNQPVLPWYKRVIRKEKIGLVKVVRTFTYSDIHRGYLNRLLSFLSFSLTCPLGLFSFTKPDIVIASSPPIFPIFSAWIICKLRRIPFVTEVRDLWPESAVQMGILKNKLLINIMQWMEKILYNQSYKIIALTEGIKNDICRRGWIDKKVVLVNCGVDINKLYPDDESRVQIRKMYNLENKKIILYFGALGEANNIGVILRAAKLLKSHEDICFMLIGDGMQSQQIMEKMKELDLENVILHKPVPKDQARAYINAADICVVTLLDIPLFSGALPTKMLDYMACGKPVLCGVRGEAKRVVEESKAGFVFEPNDDKQFSELILDLIENENTTKMMSKNGIEFIQDKFSSSKMFGLIEEIVISA
jgi:glycosyltransferase involved in cell wall biosynthesis